MKAMALFAIIALLLLQVRAQIACPLGQFLNRTSMLCLNCSSGCTTLCFGVSTAQCTYCPSGQTFNLEQLTCLTSSQMASINTTSFHSNFSLTIPEFQIKYSSLPFSLYQGQNQVQIATPASSIYRSNIIFVSPSSIYTIELGTFSYPYKSLSDAEIEVFNNFYQKFDQAVIAVDKTSSITLNQMHLIDTSNVILTTYNKTTGIVDYSQNGQSIFQNPQGQLVISSKSTSTLTSAYKIMQSLSYNFTSRLASDPNKFRINNGLSSSAQFSKLSPYYILFNSSFTIQNFKLSDDQELQLYKESDFLFVILNKGSVNQFKMSNCQYQSMMRMLESQSYSDVAIQASYFNMTSLKHLLIDYSPNVYQCTVTPPGRLRIEKSLFNGSLSIRDRALIQHNAINELTFMGNTFNNYQITNEVAILSHLASSQCPSIINGTQINHRITDNKFQNSVGSSNQGYFDFCLQDYSSKTVYFNITENTIQNAIQTRNFFQISQPQQIFPLIIDFSFSILSKSKVDSNSIVLSFSSIRPNTVNLKNVALKDSEVNLYLKYDSPLGSLAINGLQITNITDNQANFQNRQLFSILNAQLFTLSSSTIQSSTFYIGSVFTLNNVQALQSQGLTIKSNKFYRMSVITIQTLTSCNLASVSIDGNTVPQRSKAYLISVIKADLRSQNYLAQINFLSTSNSNQLPILNIQSFSQSDSSNVNMPLSIRNSQISNNIVKNGNLFRFGESSTSKVNIVFQNVTFSNNQIWPNQLISLLLCSLNVTFKQVKFQQNNGTLLESSPNNCLKDSSYQLQTFFDTLTMDSNICIDCPLIVLSKQSYIKISNPLSVISNNFVLSQEGLISFLQSNSLLEISDVSFISNFAQKGGVFFIQHQSTVNAVNCQFRGNYALSGSIAYVTSNGQFLFTSTTFQDNFALKNQLFTLVGNYINPSSIQQSQILKQTANTDMYQNLVYIRLQMQTIFPSFTDYSLIDSLQSSNQSDCMILVQSSQLWISQSGIQNSHNFIQEALQSLVTISDSVISNSFNNGFILLSILSKGTLSNCSFTNITSFNQDNYLFQIQINSIVNINNSSFTLSTGSFFQVQNSQLILDQCRVADIGFESPFIKIQFTQLTIQNSQFQAMTSINAQELFNFDRSSIIVSAVDISNFNSQAYLVTKSTFQMTSSSIKNFIFFNSVGVLLDDSPGISVLDSNVSVSHSLFRNISSRTNGGGLFLSQSQGSRLVDVIMANIVNCTFELCTSENGGAILADNINANITNSTFNNNSASKGGAVYFQCCEDCDVTNSKLVCLNFFSFNNCTRNSAWISGGCHQTNLFSVANYLSSNYTNNTAPYGNNYGAYPFQTIRVLNEGEIDLPYVTVVSGQQIEDSLVFAMIDMYNQIIINDNSSIGKISASMNEFTIDGQDQALSRGGIFNYTQSSFTSRPGQNGTLIFFSDDINTAFYEKVMAKPFEKLKIMLFFRYCTYGEAINGQKCVNCQNGTYSLSENSDQCFLCPDHAICWQNEINPDPGYWRSSNFSTQVIKCLYDEACTGGAVQSCNSDLGYYGRLCHECVFNPNDTNLQFTRSGDHKCSLCPDKKTNLQRYLLVFFANQGYIFFLTYSYYKNIILEKENTVLLRILTTYSQIVNMISQFQMNWPTLIQSLFIGLSAPSQATQALYSVECIMKDFNVIGDEQTITVQLAITTLYPVVQFSLAMIVYFFAWIFRMKQIKIKILITSTAIYYINYPNIVSNTFNLFTCTEAIDGQKYLIMNTFLECFGPTHVKLILLLAIPNLIIWIFGVPIFLLVAIFRNRKNLDNENTLRMYGFWYLGLRREHYYWELILEYKKLIMILITVDIMGMGQNYQAFFILMVLYLYFILSSNIKPYKISHINKVSYYGEYAQMCTFAFMMIYLRPSTNPLIDNVMFVLLLVINSLFWVRWFFYYGKFYFNMLRGYWIKLKNKIKKKPQPADSSQSSEDESAPKGTDESEKQRLKELQQLPQAKRLYKLKHSIMKAKQVKSIVDAQTLFPDIKRSRGESDYKGSFSPGANEFKRQQKIKLIKVKKEKMKLIKQKTFMATGPIGIKLEDYIREERKTFKADMKEAQQKKAEDKKEEQQIELNQDDQIKIKDFNIVKDKDGHLLNAEVLSQIKKLI